MRPYEDDLTKTKPKNFKDAMKHMVSSIELKPSALLLNPNASTNHLMETFDRTLQ